MKNKYYDEYYNYSLNHTENELLDKYYDDNHNKNKYLPSNELIDIINKVYKRNYIISDNLISKIVNNLNKYMLYYYDKVGSGDYLGYKDKVILSLVVMLFFRNNGYDYFIKSDNELVKMANDFDYQRYCINFLKK